MRAAVLPLLLSTPLRHPHANAGAAQLGRAAAGMAASPARCCDCVPNRQRRGGGRRRPAARGGGGGHVAAASACEAARGGGGAVRGGGGGGAAADRGGPGTFLLQRKLWVLAAAAGMHARGAAPAGAALAGHAQGDERRPQGAPPQRGGRRLPTARLPTARIRQTLPPATRPHPGAPVAQADISGAQATLDEMAAQVRAEAPAGTFEPPGRRAARPAHPAARWSLNLCARLCSRRPLATPFRHALRTAGGASSSSDAAVAARQLEVISKVRHRPLPLSPCPCGCL